MGLLVLFIMLIVPTIFVAIYEKLYENMKDSKRLQYFVWAIASITFILSLVIVSFDIAVWHFNKENYLKAPEENRVIFFSFLCFIAVPFLDLIAVIIGLCVLKSCSKKWKEDFPIPSLIQCVSCIYFCSCPCSTIICKHLILIGIGITSFMIFLQFSSFHISSMVLAAVVLPVETLSHVIFYLASFFFFTAIVAFILKFTDKSGCDELCNNCGKCNSGGDTDDTGSHGNRGGDNDDTGNHGNRGGDTDDTRNHGNRGGDTDDTGNHGNRGGDTGNSGGDTENHGNRGGNTDDTENHGNRGGDTDDTENHGNRGGDTDDTGNHGNRSGDTGNSGGDTENHGNRGGNTDDTENHGNRGGDTDDTGNHGNRGGDTDDTGNHGNRGGDTNDTENHGNRGGDTDDTGNHGNRGGDTNDTENHGNHGGDTDDTGNSGGDTENHGNHGGDMDDTGNHGNCGGDTDDTGNHENRGGDAGKMELCKEFLRNAAKFLCNAAKFLRNAAKFCPIFLSILILAVSGILFGIFFFLSSTMIEKYHNNGGILAFVGVLIPSTLTVLIGLCKTSLMGCIVLRQGKQDIVQWSSLMSICIHLIS